MPRLKAYLAHNFEARDWLREEVAPALVANGVEVTSRWIREEHSMTRTPKRNHELAHEDLCDVFTADLLVYFAEKWAGKPGLGKHLELGFALGCNKQVAIIGELADLNSVFHWLTYPNVHRFAKWTDLVYGLQGIVEAIDREVMKGGTERA